MSNLRTITLKVNPDYTVLGETATREDLDRYATNLAAHIKSTHEVNVYPVWGTSGQTTSCPDDAEIDRWLG